jgi:hypothetical protein
LGHLQGRTREDQHELLAPVAAGNVFAPDLLLEEKAKVTQQGIAAEPAELGVELLEVIDVECAPCTMTS